MLFMVILKAPEAYCISTVFAETNKCPNYLGVISLLYQHILLLYFLVIFCVSFNPSPFFVLPPPMLAAQVSCCQK